MTDELKLLIEIRNQTRKQWNWLSCAVGALLGGFGTLAMLALICLVQNMKR